MLGRNRRPGRSFQSCVLDLVSSDAAGTRGVGGGLWNPAQQIVQALAMLIGMHAPGRDLVELECLLELLSSLCS